MIVLLLSLLVSSNVCKYNLMIIINWQSSVVKLNDECMLYHCQKLDLTLDYLG